MKMGKQIPVITRIVMMFAIIAMAVTMFPSAVQADSGEAPYDDGNLILKKTATLKDDGTYQIDLEAYAKGTVSTTTETKPTDIVMVLDVSGSMDDYITSYSYTARSSSSYTYRGYKGDSGPGPGPGGGGSQSNQYYYKEGDNYYLVSAGSQDVGSGGYNGYGYGSKKTTYYYLYYTKNNTTYYLDGTSTTTTMPTSYDSEDDTLYTGILYERNTVTSTEKKIDALKTAAKNFVNTTLSKNNDLAADKMSRIAIVKFAKDESSDENSYTQLSNGYNVTQICQPLVAVDSTVAANMCSGIDSMSATGATAADYGFERATKAFKDVYGSLADMKNDTTRNKVVIFFTDGEPNHGSGFTNSVATTTIGKAETLKTDGDVKIYTVGFFSDANADIDPLTGTYPSDDAAKFNRYMHGVSSNFTNATSFTTDTLGTRTEDSDYYKVATDSESLKKDFEAIFAQISKESSSTIVSLNANSVLKDVVTDQFDISDANILAETYNFAGKDGDDYTFEASPSSTIRDSEITDDELKEKTITVNGFDYSQNHCVTKNGTNTGAELKVTISGLKLNSDKGEDSSDVGEIIWTNGTASGLYETEDDESTDFLFPVPITLITKKAYVVDYAKQVTLTSTYNTDWFMSTIDSISNTIGVKSDNAPINSTYGTFTKDGNSVKYEPRTTKWNGYDSVYVFGTTTNSAVKNEDEYPNANANGNLWSKVTVIPANNVYYEDTFVTTSADDTTKTRIIGIKYSDKYKEKKEEGKEEPTQYEQDMKWDTEGTGSNESKASETDDDTGDLKPQGWEASLADDTGYSDGTAHVTTCDNGTSTAEFEFTGTGVDIYSETNAKAGVILLVLEGVDDVAKTYVENLNIQKFGYQKDDNGYYYEEKDEDENVTKKYVDYTPSSQMYEIVDDYSKSSGESSYYQIPTASFTGLDYGTYRIKIYTQASDDTYINDSSISDSERCYYCLDGIRIYNPIKPTEEDSTVTTAYGSEESGTTYREIRSLIESGNVFVDEDKEGVTQQHAIYVSDSDNYGTTTDGYGPKHEVYLGENDSVIISVATKNNFVGIKAINLAEIKKYNDNKSAEEAAKTSQVEVSCGNEKDADGKDVKATIDINSASDMYYKVVAHERTKEDGTKDYIIEVKNTGDSIIALTKLRYVGPKLTTSTTSALKSYATDFETMDVVKYNNTVERTISELDEILQNATSTDENEKKTTAETDTSSDGKTDASSDGKTDTSSDGKTDTSSDGKTDVSSDNKADTSSDAKSDSSDQSDAKAATSKNNTITASNVTKKASSKAQTFKLNVKVADKAAKVTFASNNKKIKVDKNGKVTIAKNYVGSAKITITAAATTSSKKASKTITVTVNPKSTKLIIAKNVSGKKINLLWATFQDVSGYKIQYSTDKSFKKAVKTVTVKKAKTGTKMLKGLKKNKTYYVRVATYKKVSKKTYTSSWTKAKIVRIRK